MPINIKNREAERLLDWLSEKKRMRKSQVVLELLRREAAVQARLAGVDERKKRIIAISRRAARRTGPTAPAPDQIIDYDERGLAR